MNAKLDRRKKYTRMVLKESLINLLKEKQISSITVKELCELADINRSTFYSHYADPYDLLTKIEEEILVDMYQTLSSYNFNKEDEALQMTEKILEYVADNRNVCQTLLSEHGDPQFQHKVMKVTYDFTMKNWMEIHNADEKVSEYLSLYVISGSLHVLKNWLDNGMDKTPREMAELIHSFTSYGLGAIK
ncbi:TetR/AcrR family transcriptional regulator [Alkalihalophilus pseudofirmus OF4]|uniref:TetR/AcrR family transcriptional regulator n=1 Tax=Alkalihalophilus pseudofirmus (strain ATCC BAA-2126 / JCM 17055 / OF4) TaxID=398511 RepID=D3FQM3_ALKPO|nr:MULTISPECIES: TetR-like C-terminal domain-containing protein [Alkalihalophilus]ADC51393.1 TetR/AcrR family transcriptional regulator [Alkalihalophilus pseudofirmus OF4]MED1601976.1 TetR-like C-terminal domain-containing protein [Alkalihalophilus marmarensis]OLS38178.1 TetR family transcriptional regulator [Alkalihalophilus pseudofirmus]